MVASLTTEEDIRIRRAGELTASRAHESKGKLVRYKSSVRTFRTWTEIKWAKLPLVKYVVWLQNILLIKSATLAFLPYQVDERLPPQLNKRQKGILPKAVQTYLPRFQSQESVWLALGFNNRQVHFIFALALEIHCRLSSKPLVRIENFQQLWCYISICYAPCS